MENIISKEKTLTYSIAIPIVIVLSVAAMYFGVCMLTPLLSKTSLLGLQFGKTIKLANMLRALVLVSPAAVVGTGVGAIAFNVATGTSVVGAYPILPLAIMTIGLFINKYYTRTTIVKDFAILAGYGLLTGILVSFTHIVALFTINGLSLVILYAVLSKLAISMLTVMAGYPIVLFWRKLIKEKE